MRLCLHKQWLCSRPSSRYLQSSSFRLVPFFSFEWSNRVIENALCIQHRRYFPIGGSEQDEVKCSRRSGFPIHLPEVNMSKAEDKRIHASETWSQRHAKRRPPLFITGKSHKQIQALCKALYYRESSTTKWPEVFMSEQSSPRHSNWVRWEKPTSKD